MRNMSFMLTTEQVKNRTKTVTRRLGWKNLKPGTLVRACEKCMGLKKGEKIKELAVIRIVSNTPEPLMAITDEEVLKEGFPGKTKGWFCHMFGEKMCVTQDQEVNRIEFEYL